MISSTYNRVLLRFAPHKLLKRYTGKTAEKMYFIREYELAVRQVWKAKFFREQKKELREDMRREYDKSSETLNALELRFQEEGKKEAPDKEIVDALQAKIESTSKDISQFKEQVDQIDAEIKGYTEALDSLEVTLPSVEKHLRNL